MLYLSMGLAFVIPMVVIILLTRFMFHRRKFSQKGAATKHYEGMQASKWQSIGQLGVDFCPSPHVFKVMFWYH